MHEATWQALLDNITDYVEEDALFSNMGKHSLKGISKQVYITQVRPGPMRTIASFHWYLLWLGLWWMVYMRLFVICLNDWPGLPLIRVLCFG